MPVVVMCLIHLLAVASSVVPVAIVMLLLLLGLTMLLLGSLTMGGLTLLLLLVWILVVEAVAVVLVVPLVVHITTVLLLLLLAVLLLLVLVVVLLAVVLVSVLVMVWLINPAGVVSIVVVVVKEVRLPVVSLVVVVLQVEIVVGVVVQVGGRCRGGRHGWLLLLLSMASLLLVLLLLLGLAGLLLLMLLLLCGSCHRLRNLLLLLLLQRLHGHWHRGGNRLLLLLLLALLLVVALHLLLLLHGCWDVCWGQVVIHGIVGAGSLRGDVLRHLVVPLHTGGDLQLGCLQLLAQPADAGKAACEHWKCGLSNRAASAVTEVSRQPSGIYVCVCCTWLWCAGCEHICTYTLILVPKHSIQEPSQPPQAQHTAAASTSSKVKHDTGHSRVDLRLHLPLQSLPVFLDVQPVLLALVVAGHLVAQVLLVGLNQRIGGLQAAGRQDQRCDVM
jgi:hypothetical protein